MRFLKSLAERLKSPVVWGTVIIVAQDRLNILDRTGFTPKNIAVSAGIVALTLLSALNNPTDRDGP